MKHMIGARIRSRRMALGLTQRALAERVRTSRQAVVQHECGHREDPQISTLQRFARALGVSVSWLIGEETEK